MHVRDKATDSESLHILSEQIELIQNYVGFNEDEIKDEETDVDF